MIQYLNGLKAGLSGVIRSSSGLIVRLPCPVNYQQSSATLGTLCMNFKSSGQDDFTERQLCFSRNTLMNASNDSQIWSLTQKRYRWRPKLVRSPPTKPLHFDYSWDQSMSLGSVDSSEPKLGYESVEELQDADEIVKKIYSLEYSNNHCFIEKLVHNLLEKVKDHPLDLQSLEVKIANDTIMIRNLIRHCLSFRNDKFNKSWLIKRIFRRRHMLTELKSKDIEKFNWLVDELKIKYLEVGKFDNWKLSKKGLRKKVARDAAIALIKQKSEAFQNKLNQERIVFEKYRDAELAKIEDEFKEMGIPMMGTLRETLEALNLGDMLPKPAPWKSRRRTLLQKKIELYMPQKKITDDKILTANGFLTEQEMPYLP